MSNSIYENRARKYLEDDIMGKYGISFLDYMELTRNEIDRLHKILRQHNVYTGVIKQREEERLKREQAKKMREEAKAEAENNKKINQ